MYFASILKKWTEPIVIIREASERISIEVTYNIHNM